MRTSHRRSAARLSVRGGIVGSVKGPLQQING